jgi:hypothetical protein
MDREDRGWCVMKLLLGVGGSAAVNQGAHP